MTLNAVTEKTHTFTVPGEKAAERIDIFITGKIEGLTRSGVKRLIDEGHILLNGKPVKAGHKLRENDLIEVRVPAVDFGSVVAEEIPLDIVYEDSDIIVINKPAGMSAHPGAGRATGTLVNALLAHTRELSRLGGAQRAGIVHRLDKDTTGVLVVARNDASHGSLSKQFKDRTAGRKYMALAWGSLKDDEGSIDLPIGRDSADRKKISPRARITRKAITNYRVLKRFPFLTLLELKLETGRTHQIRVHLTAINHPVVGDQTYGKRTPPPAMPKHLADRIRRLERQCLHAFTLTIAHPKTGEEMEFTAPLPEDMQGLITALEETYGNE